jgi:hypothetical protein
VCSKSGGIDVSLLYAEQEVLTRLEEEVIRGQHIGWLLTGHFVKGGRYEVIQQPELKNVDEYEIIWFS